MQGPEWKQVQCQRAKRQVFESFSSCDYFPSKHCICRTFEHLLSARFRTLKKQVAAFRHCKEKTSSVSNVTNFELSQLTFNWDVMKGSSAFNVLFKLRSTDLRFYVYVWCSDGLFLVFGWLRPLMASVTGSCGRRIVFRGWMSRRIRNSCFLLTQLHIVQTTSCGCPTAKQITSWIEISQDDA